MFVEINQLNKVLEKLAKPGKFGLDTETTGLLWKDRVFSIIISDDEESYYFNYKMYPGIDKALVLPRDSIKSLQSVLGNTNSTFFIHNAKFDWNMLSKEGLSILGKVWCTHSVERVIKNNHFPESLYNLDNCAQRNLGQFKDSAVEEYIEKHKLFSKAHVPGKKKIEKIPHYDQVPFEVIAPYAMKDAKLHRDLGLWQEKELTRLEQIHPARGTLPAITSIAANEIRLTRTCAKMEQLGVKVDVPYILEAQTYETLVQQNLKKEFKNMTGLDFVDGPKLLAQAFAGAGLAPGRTEKGNASFTADVLEEMNTPLTNTINQIRKIEKRVGTYYSSFLYLRDQNDVIHPNLKQGGTVTGRFSCSNPNLQNVPKEEGENKYHIRGCFVPRPGYTFISCDYSQQEFRLLLDYAGEHRLIAEVNAGADVHQSTADLVGISRKHAKTLNFALLYGAGSEKIAAQLGIMDCEARELKQNYFGKLPGVKRFLSLVQRVVKQRGYVCNAFGRVCHIDDPDFAFTGVNHIIQGTGGDCIKFAMNKIDEELPEIRMILQIHDELLLEMLPEEFDLIPKIRGIMESMYKPQNKMLLPTSVAYSTKSWAARDMVEGLPC